MSQIFCHSFRVLASLKFCDIIKRSLLTHPPSGDFAEKTRFEAWAVFWALSCYKELKLTTKLITGRTLCSLLIQMQHVSLWGSGMRRKQNFEIVFGLKSDTAVLTLLFGFTSLLPSYFAFLASFFSPAGHLVGFILVGKVLFSCFPYVFFCFPLFHHFLACFTQWMINKDLYYYYYY